MLFNGALIIFGSLIAVQSGHPPGHSMICDETDQLTVPSKCCHEGQSLLKKDTLRGCQNQKQTEYPEFDDTLSTLFCYFNTSGLINGDGQIDVEKSNEHFMENYPIATMDLFSCSSSIDGKQLNGNGQLSQSLIHWLMCLERSLIECPDEEKITNKKCESMHEFLDECLHVMARMDYFLKLEKHLIAVDDN